MAIFKSRKKSASASLQTKTATADTDDILVIPDTGYDGMSAVTVHPTPSETKTVTAGTSDVTVTPTSGKYLSEVTVEPTPSQSKSVTATTSSQTVSPDTGKLLSSVTVSPQAHTTTYTPSANTAANDMGANHEYRYVNTSGMIVPSGTKYITQNGQSDVTNYATVDVNVSEIPSENLEPNNSFPDPIANGMAYQAMGNGYAIASYDSITPSSVGDFVSSGDIVKFGGNGVIFDSIPVPDLQVKTVTATTSGQIVEPDSGYDGLLSVVVNPQVHTATYVPDEDTAQNDMDDIHNYRYVNTSGMVRPSSITPSNSTPASLTSGSAITPSANGYAISSYQSVGPNYIPFRVFADDMIQVGNDGYIIEDYENVTPSSTPRYVDEYDIVRLGGSGVIVDSIPTPTSLTPSNATPATITSGETYTATANGKAVASVTDVTPTTVDGPETMTANNIYRPTINSYAINSYTQVQSSDSNPPTLSPGGMYRIPSAAGMGGYLYKSSGLGKCKSGTFTASTSSTTTITLGFKPKYVCVFIGTTSACGLSMYNEDIWGSGYFVYGSSSANIGRKTLPSTSVNQINSITSTGFVYNKVSSGLTSGYYFAIG